MEFYDVVRRRRMIRSYRPDPVPQEAVERIISATLRGPSAGYSQGIELIVVTEQAMRRKVAETLEDEEEEESAPLDAPVLLIITADEERYHRRYNEPDKLALGGGEEIGWPVPYWYIDAGAALMLALLAAVDEGLAAGFFGHPDHVARLQEVLSLPAYAVPIGVMAVGYSAEDSPPPELRQRLRARRRPQSERVHRQRW